MSCMHAWHGSSWWWLMMVDGSSAVYTSPNYTIANVKCIIISTCTIAVHVHDVRCSRLGSYNYALAGFFDAFWCFPGPILETLIFTSHETEQYTGNSPSRARPRSCLCMESQTFQNTWMNVISIIIAIIITTYIFFNSQGYSEVK